MAATLTDLEKVTASIAVVDALGNPAAVDVAPSWTSSDPATVTVSPAEDGLTAVISSVGPIGQATVSVSADADLGEGIQTISADLLVDIVASQATGLTINVGTPEPR